MDIVTRLSYTKKTAIYTEVNYYILLKVIDNLDAIQRACMLRHGKHASVIQQLPPNCNLKTQWAMCNNCKWNSHWQRTKCRHHWTKPTCTFKAALHTNKN